MKIQQPTVGAVIRINEYVCREGGSPHVLLPGAKEKIESALHSAFYPGAHPFQHGGVAGIAGAMTFYLTRAHAFQDGNKRTAAIVGSTFMEMNGCQLKYVSNIKSGRNDFAEIILGCASGKSSKDEVMNWFESHKVRTRE